MGLSRYGCLVALLVTWAAFAQVQSAVAVERVAGPGRVQTAVAVAQLRPASGVGWVVLARADDYADALTGGPLAHRLGAPLLLTGHGALDADTAAEVRRLGADRALVLGGTAALSPAVEEGLRAAGATTVERIAGADRFVTAALIAERLGGPAAYLAEGAHPDPRRGWPDALAVSPLAAHEGRPVLLTASGRLPGPTADALGGLGIRAVTVVGGDVAVSAPVADEVAGLVERLDRIAGADRYETAALVVDRALASGLTPERLWVASGQGWPDALVAGPAVAVDRGLLLLAAPGRLADAPPTERWLRAHRDAVAHVRVVGGSAAISERTEREIRDLFAIGTAADWRPESAYRTGDVVTHRGRSWTALSNSAGWEPGADGAVGPAIGFGTGAGGAGGFTYWVTTLADDGPGSLREALTRPGPRWVRFAVSGELRLESAVAVPSQTTLDGRGQRVTITHRGLELAGVHDVVVTNLRFTGITGSPNDAVQVRDGSRRVWIDHCDLADGQDGLIDITRGATDVTVSWNRFTEHTKVMLINTEQYDGPLSRVTLHHNLFDGTDQRHPHARQSQVHAFNNHVRGWISYGMQSAGGGQLYSQANVFTATSDLDALISQGRSQGSLRSEGDLLRNGARSTQRDPDRVFTPPYPATPDPADDTLITTLDTHAGWQPVPADGPWR